MKKKIKDLTRDEIESICKSPDCSQCPLYINGYLTCKHSYKHLNKYGEEEVEVD